MHRIVKISSSEHARIFEEEDEDEGTNRYVPPFNESC